VAHSIEALFDDDTDAAIRREWAALADAGLPSQAHHRSPTNRPHVTLAVSRSIGAAVDAELATITGDLPLACRLGAPLVFGAGPVTLARLVVPSAALIRLHGRVYEITAPHQPSGPFPHALPGEWTPHVTLCRRLAVADLPAALAELGGDPPAGELAQLRRWDGDARIDHLLG
jgi:hypothetical protein